MSKIAPTKETTNLLSESLKLYYNSNLLDLKPIPDLKFRHFRLRLLDGYFYKIKRKLRTSEDLRKCLTDNTPLDVYYSTATWLNPHLIASRLDSNILRNIYLSCDLSFDIDVSNKIKTLTEAKTQAIMINDFLDSKGFNVRYIAFSGSKGFHIVCDDPWKSEENELEPYKREMKAIAERKKLVREASNARILFDEKVTVDTRRIIRLPGTINSKTGYACTILSKKTLESDIEIILKLANHVDFNAPRIPQQREMTAPSASNIPGFLGRLGVRPRPEQNICYSLFYTNNIPETQLKIPILEFEGWTQREKLYQIIEKTQHQYRLGDIYLFGDGEKFWAVSLKALSRRRVEKILGFSGSTNIYQCKKYGCTYTRIGKSIDVEGNTIQYEPRLIKIIESDLSAQVSRTHHEFFTSLGITLRDDGNLLCGAGLDKLELVHAIIE
jgi:DNA primase catalytic subunit